MQLAHILLGLASLTPTLVSAGVACNAQAMWKRHEGSMSHEKRHVYDKASTGDEGLAKRHVYDKATIGDE